VAVVITASYQRFMISKLIYFDTAATGEPMTFK